MPNDLTKAIIKSAAGKAEDVFWPTDHETKVWASERDDANKSAHELMQHGSPVSCMSLHIGLNA